MKLSWGSSFPSRHTDCAEMHNVRGESGELGESSRRYDDPCGELISYEKHSPTLMRQPFPKEGSRAMQEYILSAIVSICALLRCAIWPQWSILALRQCTRIKFSFQMDATGR